MKLQKKSMQNGWNNFVQIFGGEEIMQEKYPKTYEAYNNTKNGKVLEAADESIGDYEVEIVHVSYTDETKEYVQVDVRAMASDENGYCILKVSLPQITQIQQELGEDAYEIYEAESDFIGNDEEVSLVIPKRYFHYAENRMDGVLILCASVYSVDNVVQLYECEQNINAYGLDYTSVFTIEAPKIVHPNTENKDINIAYLWQYGFSKDILDYYYSRDELTNHGLHIPGKGFIEVSGINLKGLSKCSLMAGNDAGETVYHDTATATISNNCILWEFEDDWGVPYDDILNSFYCYTTYQLEIQANAGGKPYTFVVTNREGTRQAINKHVLNKIYIYKDCFAKGQMVSMADGSKKEIQTLIPGDIVKTAEGCTTVKETALSDWKTSVTQITGKNGQNILVSSHHPLMTSNGFLCAAYLEPGMEVLTQEGSVVVTEKKTVADMELWAVMLEDAVPFYVNGFLAGDSATILTEADIQKNLYYQVKAGWRKDYLGWVERNKGRK